MTRKDFIVIADAITRIEDVGDRAEVEQLLATVCANSNPSFDYVRFDARIVKTAAELWGDK